MMILAKEGKYRSIGFRCDLKGYRRRMVYPQICTYLDNGRLAILMRTAKGEDEPYVYVTKNLPNEDITDVNCAFVDENNVPDIVAWILRNGMGTRTGRFGLSGYCVYTEIDFTPLLARTVGVTPDE